MRKKLSFKYKIAIHLLNILSKTWRIELRGEKPKNPCVIAFWHGGMMPIWKYFSKNNYCGVVSQSRDGEILARLLNKWGYTLIRGSSSKDGREVLSSLVVQLESNSILLTPDGPRGPNKRFKAGAAVAAMRSCRPLYLIRPVYSSRLNFKNSWDKFALPLPFAKITLHISDAFFIDKDTSRKNVDSFISNFENILNDN